MKPLVKNANNESEVRSAQIKEKMNQDAYDSALKNLLQTEMGRIVIWKLLGDCRLFQTNFTGSSETFFLEGKRAVGLQLLADVMRLDPESFIKMQQSKFKEF